MAFVDIAIIGGVTSVTVPGAAAGIGAGAAAAGGLGALGTGLTMGQIGSGLSAASSALNLGSKLFGSGAQGQGQAGRAALNMGGAGEPGNVKPFVIDPRATTSAPAVPNPFGGSTPNIGGQQGPQDFYSQEQDQQGDQQVQHFDDGGGVWGDPLGDVAYDKDYNLIYDRSSTATTPTNYETLYTQPDKESSWLDWFKKTNPKTGETSYDWGKIGLLGLGGMGIASLFSKPSLLPKYQQPTAQQYGLGARLASNYAPQRRFADGGIAALSPNPTFPMSQQQTSRYAVPSQMPVGATDIRMAHLGPVAMASGGALGGYSDGGRMLKGPGDGMSDDIPATISGKQPARLADGEFVVPADVVSHLGNGSTDAGAKQLYKMMDKVRTARTGRKAQGKQIKPSKYIPT